MYKIIIIYKYYINFNCVDNNYYLVYYYLLYFSMKKEMYNVIINVQ